MRLEAAQGLTVADGHALAGFIDAEGSFGIGSNNAGSTWSCTFDLAQRDDDADVLHDLARVTGIGRVTYKRAQGRSHPQATWTVNAKRECAELARLLRRYPLRGRKRVDADTWIRAVDIWARELYDRRSAALHVEMRALQAQLRRGRRYIHRVGGRVARADADDALRSYFGGFFSGDGHLAIVGTSVGLSVHLRDDDRDLLEMLADAFGIGKVMGSHATKGKPSTAHWRVTHLTGNGGAAYAR